MLTEVSAPLHVLRRRRDEHGWTLVEGTYAFALPGGRTLRAAYEHLRDAILDQLAAVGPVDLVALSLHGAMCAVGYRSEERRVGKECVSTCRSRWSPYH